MAWEFSGVVSEIQIISLTVASGICVSETELLEAGVAPASKIIGCAES
jgi:hypothetical protein